jgi:Planctomycete cytochrome C
MNTRTFGFAFAAAAIVVSAAPAANAQKFTSRAGSFSFSLPQRWNAEEQGGAAKITAPDGSVYILDRDCVKGGISGSPLNDAAARRYAADTAAALGATGNPIRSVSVQMDHGQGATFRFNTSDGKSIDVWIASVAGRTFSLIPERAGLPAQTIAITSLFQTINTQANAVPTPVPGGGSPANAIRTISYKSQIAPLMRQRCNNCHSEESGSGNLSTATYRGLLAGGNHGPIIAKGSASQSVLFDYLTGVKDQMPKGSAPLSADEISILKQWIDQGAVNDTGTRPAPKAGKVSTNVPEARSTPVVTAGARPMEIYSGHLAVNDESFKLTLFTDQTARADWEFAKSGVAGLQGGYTETAGVYTINMNVVSGSLPGGQKSVKLLMQPGASQVEGTFALDGGAKYKVIGLQLTEMENANRKSGAGSAGTTGTGRSAAAKRRNTLAKQQRKLVQQQQKLIKKALKRKKIP